MDLDRRFLHRMALFMWLVSASLGVAGTLHLAGAVHGRVTSFDPSSAGAAEVIIGIVLAVGAAFVWRATAGARAAGLGALGFTIAGFLVGLSFTATGGALPDIGYHVVTLPLLIAAFTVLARAGRAAPKLGSLAG